MPTWAIHAGSRANQGARQAPDLLWRTERRGVSPSLHSLGCPCAQSVLAVVPQCSHLDLPRVSLHAPSVWFLRHVLSWCDGYVCVIVSVYGRGVSFPSPAWSHCTAAEENERAGASRRRCRGRGIGSAALPAGRCSMASRPPAAQPEGTVRPIDLRVSPAWRAPRRHARQLADQRQRGLVRSTEPPTQVAPHSPWLAPTTTASKAAHWTPAVGAPPVVQGRQQPWQRRRDLHRRPNGRRCDAPPPSDRTIGPRAPAACIPGSPGFLCVPGAARASIHDSGARSCGSPLPALVLGHCSCPPAASRQARAGQCRSRPTYSQAKAVGKQS